MAKVELNPVFMSIRGAAGGYVIKKYGEKFVLARKPVFVNRKFTRAQKEQQKKFKFAAEQAKAVMSNPVKRKKYEREAEAIGKPIMSILISEFMNKK